MNIRGTASIYLIFTLIQLAACSSTRSDSAESTERVTASGVGASCVPGDATKTNFPGYSVTEVSLETGASRCESGTCLAYAFQGRVGCPYGEDCTTPSGDPVTATVQPQLVSRPSDDSVYCSCRCDGPEGQAPFCECPEAFECRPIVSDFGIGGGGAEYAGSYCVKRGTYVEDASTLKGGPACDSTLANCEGR